MKTTILFLISFVLISCNSEEGGKSTPAVLDPALQGRWEANYIIHPKQYIETITIAGDQASYQVEQFSVINALLISDVTTNYTLQAVTNEAALGINTTDSIDTWSYTYRVDGNTLRICNNGCVDFTKI